MNRAVFLIAWAISCLLPLTISGQTIDAKIAGEVASRFMEERLEVNTATSGTDSRVDRVSWIKTDDLISLYVIHFEPEGWVILNASTATYPVAAYSLKGKWKDEAGPWKMWVDAYAEQVSQAVKQAMKPDEQVSHVWNTYLFPGKRAFAGYRGVQPLLLSTWDQGVPYNQACPPDPSGPGGHAVTGCVATACAQLMYYFRFPDQGSGSYSYVHPVYDTLAVDFSAATYEWDKMLNVAQTSNPEMAELAYHFGVSVDMVFGPHSSGMYNHKAAYSLKTHFNYSPETQYVFRDSTSMDWDSLLVTHLDRRIPLYYAGWEAPGSWSGHAFICDGYETTAQGNFYHFNWGWGGSQDGYFYTNNLTPGGYQFSFMQELIINAYPDTLSFTYPAYCTGSRVLTTKEGTIEDGSGPAHPYLPNTECSWLLDPQVHPYDSVKLIELRINRFQTEIGGDKLLVYDGADTNAPVLGVYSGNTYPPLIQSSGNKLFIVFMSNDSIEDDGFLISYKAVSPSWCSGTKTLQAPSATFDDGSGMKHYNNGSLCRWLIQPTGAQTLTLGFNRFDTEFGQDFLKVYDWSTQQLIGSYSGDQLPPMLTSNSGGLFLEFSTSPDQAALGWEAFYTSSGIGIDEPQSKSVQVYPNPGTGQFYLTAPRDDLTYTLFVSDMWGHVVKRKEMISHGKALHFDLGDLANGVYVISLLYGEEVSYARLVLMR